MRCTVERIIKPSPQWEITRYHDGDTADIIETILFADTKSEGFILPGVQCLIDSSQYRTLANVYKFVKGNVKYRADRRGFERVKSPGALFSSGYGDCKSLSVAIAAILKRLGIPYRYRFASYAPGDFTHVYVIAEGVNGDVILDAVHKTFDEEHPYYRHSDVKPAGSPKGIKGLTEISIDASGLVFGALLAWMILK